MANKYAVANGYFSDASTWSDTPAGAAGATPPAAGDNAYANNKTVIIAANATCTKISNQAENSATAGGGFTINDGVTLTANVTAGSTGSIGCLSVAISRTGSCTIVGNITGGTVSTASGIVVQLGGTVNVTGNVSGGTNSSGYGIEVLNDCTLNISGSVNPSQTGGVAILAQVSRNVNINITGNVYSGSLNASILYDASSISTLNIVGNVSQSGSQYCIYGGSYGSTINVTGSVTVAGTTYAMRIYSNGVLNVYGSITAGASSSAVYLNSETTRCYAVRVIGNGYGVGGSGNQYSVAISNNTNTKSFDITIEEIQFGSLGNTPISGYFKMPDKTTNVCIFYKGGGATKTLIDPESVSGLVPSVSNVRSGTSYAFGNRIGTCAVPSASSVDVGVAVDSTTGTAVLSPASVWSALTAGMTTSGSIGERLANASTVTSIGQQLANAVST